MNQINQITSGLKEKNLIGEMRSALAYLNKTEKKIAQNILADPEAATQKSIAVLAKSSGVSEPSVNRFCKRFNASGFPDFKLKLAKAAVSGLWETIQPIHPEDDTAGYTHKIINNTIASLMAVKRSVNHRQVQLAVQALLRAKRIFIFGIGASSTTAKEAESKFYQSGLFATYNDDLIMQRMIASNYRDGDLFFLISQTGETKEMIEIAELAKLNTAPTIGLAPEMSHLARLSTLKLQIERTNSLDRLSFSYQASYQVMLDILVAGISVQKKTSARFLNQDGFNDHYKVI